VVADVSGKGVPAGLVASNLQACLWARRAGSEPLTSVIADVNEILCRLTRGRKYATLVAAEWSSADESLTWVSAGHPPLLLSRGGVVREFGATGRPVGLLPDQSYRSETVPLTEGDTVLLYSDGMLEASGIDGSDEFGLDRIRACLTGHGGPRGVINRLTTALLAAHVDGGEPEDDVTLVCLRRKRAGL
jgi:serine phosphatase RsbU (regulator of sigma subunit)